MKKIIPVIFLTSTLSLHAASDSDFDGIDDKNDKCPNTPFSDLVNSRGCTTKSLYGNTSYDAIVGYDYSSANPSIIGVSSSSAMTLQADVYNGNFSAQFLTSYIKASGSVDNSNGMGDTMLAGYYTFKPSDKLMIKTGVGVIFPTYSTGYNNEATDYTANISAQYNIDKKINIFGGYGYTAINDKDVPNVVAYQNTNSFYGGLGYTGPKNSSFSLSYADSDSIYSGIDNIRAVGLEAYVPINSEWFTMSNYKYGVSDSASPNEFGVSLGYNF